MKVFLTLALCALAVSALPLEESADRINGENGWYVPQADGTYDWISMEAADQMLEENEIEGRGISTNPVSFYLFTSENPFDCQQITASKKSIDASNFNAANPTRIVIHGWTQGYEADMNKEITEAWLSQGDYNVIVVDWARARSLEYASSVMAVGGAGKKVGELIKFLNKNYKMSLDTLHVIGHSLGAHVAGYAGKTVGDEKIHTIVGLDTAMPLFNYDKTGKRLCSTDAFYVEAIHTNGGKLGFLRPVGKGDFYPNGGKSQPGCGLDVTGSCSHGRSVSYYAEAVRENNFAAQKCGTYENAVSKDCGTTYSSVRMGSPTNAYVVSGEYYVPVNKASPFGLIN